MDEENVPDHCPDPEIRDHQWIHASVYDMSPRTVIVPALMYAGLHPLDDAGLFRRNGSVRILERDQPDPDRYDPDLQYVSQ